MRKLVTDELAAQLWLWLEKQLCCLCRDAASEPFAVAVTVAAGGIVPVMVGCLSAVSLHLPAHLGCCMLSANAVRYHVCVP